MPGNQTFQAATPLMFTVLIQATDGTTARPLFAPQVGRYRIDHILVSNSDAAAHVLNCGVFYASSLYPLVATTIPARAGYDGNPVVDLAQIAPASGQDLFQFGESVDIRVQLAVAMAASQAMLIVGLGALT